MSSQENTHSFYLEFDNDGFSCTTRFFMYNCRNTLLEQVAKDFIVPNLKSFPGNPGLIQTWNLFEWMIFNLTRSFVFNKKNNYI